MPRLRRLALLTLGLVSNRDIDGIFLFFEYLYFQLWTTVIDSDIAVFAKSLTTTSWVQMAQGMSRVHVGLNDQVGEPIRQEIVRGGPYKAHAFKLVYYFCL